MNGGNTIAFHLREAAALPEGPLSDLITVGCSFLRDIHRAIEVRTRRPAPHYAGRAGGPRHRADSADVVAAEPARPTGEDTPGGRKRPSLPWDPTAPLCADPGGHQASAARRDAAAAEGRHHHRGRRGDRLATAYGPWRARRRVEGAARLRRYRRRSTTTGCTASQADCRKWRRAADPAGAGGAPRPPGSPGGRQAPVEHVELHQPVEQPQRLVDGDVSAPAPPSIAYGGEWSCPRTDGGRSGARSAVRWRVSNLWSRGTAINMVSTPAASTLSRSTSSAHGR